MTSHPNSEPQRQAAAVIDADALVWATPPEKATPISEIVTALRNVETLEGLTDREFHWLASHGGERKASHGEVVVRENEPAHHMHIILEGEVSVHRANSGSVSLFMGRTARAHWKAALFQDEVLGRHGL